MTQADNISNITIEEMKNNQEFLNFLDNRYQEAVKEKDIKTLYEVLDAYVDLEQGDKVDIVFDNILNLAFEFAEKIEEDMIQIDIRQDNNFLYIRALYEVSFALWSDSKYDNALYFFIILLTSVEDKTLADALFIHAVAVYEHIELDKFHEQWIDSTKEKDEIYTFFAINFKIDTQQYLSNSQELLDKMTDRLNSSLEG